MIENPLQKLFRYFLLGLFFTFFSTLAQAQDNTDQPLGQTYTQKEIMAAAETFFGSEYNEGLKKTIGEAIRENGAPNAYYYGQEDLSIAEIGYRYGSGRLFHKDFGSHAVFWRGPSIDFEKVVSGTKTFALIFNLHDLKSFYKRFASGETGYFFYKGVGLSYRKRLDLIVAQIRVGVEVAKGLNPAWVKFGTEKMVLPNVLPELGDFKP